MSAHTAGPWEAIGAGISSSAMTVPNASGRMIDFRVALCKDGDVDTVRANARLIAAAPDLLAALKWMMERLDAQLNINSACRVRAREAIARAEGK